MPDLDYRKIEKDVMRSLGLKPAALSGGGWVEKEDGESDRIIAQLKSTAGKSVSVKHQDMKDLIRHSRVTHKLPVFVVYFVGEEPMVMVRAGDLQKAAKYLKYPNGGNQSAPSIHERAKRNSGTKVTLSLRGTKYKEVRRNNV